MSGEVGDGWYPTVLKNGAQLNFLTAAMKYFAGSWSYWIGGSTCSELTVPLSSCGMCNNADAKL